TPAPSSSSRGRPSSSWSRAPRRTAPAASSAPPCRRRPRASPSARPSSTWWTAAPISACRWTPTRMPRSRSSRARSSCTTPAPTAKEPGRDGAIVGCNWGPGRWPGKHALEFKGVSDRVRLQVPGAFDSITLVAWVRVDGLPNGNNSLLMCDGWDEGGMPWQIGEDGKLILGVRGPAGTVNGHYHALGAFGPERLKQWTLLVTVYDRD